MKLSDYVKKFDKIEADLQNNSINTLTQDQSNIFRDIFKTYNQSGIQYAVLDAPSGTGKTTLIRAMQKYCKTNYINMVVTATTGKASSALNGQTIHSFMGMKMVANDEAENKDDALTLSSNKDYTADKDLDILVIDEASMVGRSLFSIIDRARFKYVLFVLDSSQLPPVKEKKVEWTTIADIQYKLTKTLRARDTRILKLFDDFRNYKLGNIKELSLEDYVNGDNIISIDYEDIDTMPVNTESCIVSYRNKLVEHFVDKVTHTLHSMFNLNRGVMVTKMVSTDDVPNDKGCFSRDFVQEQVYYNGEDVEIIKLGDATNAIVDNGYAIYKQFKISLNKKQTGLTIIDISAKIPYGAKESHADKYFLQLPQNEILEHCTLSIVNGKYFILLWDESEEEFDSMLEYYFSLLFPYLKTTKAIKAYRKKPNEETLSKVPVYIRSKLSSLSINEFTEWFASQTESIQRSKAWASFLSASAVVSARATTSRTIHKSQGISIPCVAISDMSFFGASKDAQYVAVTRCKHGLILIKNTPTNWKE